MGDFFICANAKCAATGPVDDYDGFKWNALMAQPHGATPPEAQPAPGLSDEELLARFAAAIVGGCYAADVNLSGANMPWVMDEARALLAEFRKAPRATEGG